MSRRYYDVTMVRGLNRKTVKISGTPTQNAAYEAVKQNPGWTVTDVR